MNIESSTIIETALAVMGGMAVAGLTVIRMMMHGVQKQHEVTQQLIEERFIWAEKRREDAKQHWEQYFEELKETHHTLSNRIYSLETRVITLELHLAKRPPLSLNKAPNPRSRAD
jgi:hypothetical protein